MAPNNPSRGQMEDSLPSFDESSSLDPLTLSPTEQHTPQPKSASRRIRTGPLAQTSPNAQRQRPTLTTPKSSKCSPSKSVTMSTGSAPGASPWRIKITVEAEPEIQSAGGARDSSPTPRTRKPRTTTTRVPLKGPDDHSRVKRRGRPRKSDTAESPKSKRSGTPVRRRSTAAKATTTNTEESDGVIGREVSAPVDHRGTKPQKRRPYKSKASTPIDQNAPSVLDLEDAAESSGFSTWGSAEEPSHLSRADPQTVLHSVGTSLVDSSLESIRVPQRRTNINFSSLTRSREKKPDRSQPRQATSHRASRHKKSAIDVAQTSQQATSSTASNLAPTDYQRTLLSSKETGDDLWCTNDVISVGTARLKERKDSTMQRNIVGTESQSEPEVVQTPETTDEEGDTAGGAAIGEQTIMESEGFSMVSVESLPSQQEAFNSPTRVRSPDTSYLPDRSTARNDGDVEQGQKLLENSGFFAPTVSSGPRNGLASNLIDSSPSPTRPSPARSREQNTPSNHHPTPQRPPTLEPSQNPHGHPNTPKLVNVIRTGVALQGVLKNRASGTTNSSDEVLETRNQRDRLDDLFSGFGEGTRRELQAGLRLGEQLALRQDTRSSSRAASPLVSVATKCRMVEDDVFASTRPSKDDEVSYPQLPTPENDQYHLTVPRVPVECGISHGSVSGVYRQESRLTPESSADEMSWRADTPKSALRSTVTFDQNIQLDVANRSAIDEDVSHCSLPNRPDLQACWQQERGEVIRQTRSATPNQVIQISSDVDTTSEGQDDSNTGDNNETDFWHQQATWSPQPRSIALEGARGSHASSPGPGDFLANNSSILMPRRSKIPILWRRKSSSKFTYSDELDQEPNMPTPRSSPPPINVRQTTETPQGKTSSPGEAPDTDDSGLFWHKSLPALFVEKDQRAPGVRRDRVDIPALSADHGIEISDSPVKHAPHTNSSERDPPQHVTLPSSPIHLRPTRQSIDFNTNVDTSFHESSLMERSQSINETVVTQTEEDSTALDVRQLRAEMEAQGQRELQERYRRQASENSQPCQYGERSKEMTFRDDKSRPRGNAYGLAAHAVPLNPQPVAGPGLISRLGSTIWNTLPFASAVEPEPHPLQANYPLLPQSEPWTRTHYEVLDSMYQAHKRHPHMFSPSDPDNAALLASHPAFNTWVDSRMKRWGYGVVMNARLIVISALFYRLLKLKRHEDYRGPCGEVIVFGDCASGSTWRRITEKTVVLRMFSVVVGEAVRRDERHGLPIDRSGELEIDLRTES